METIIKENEMQYKDFEAYLVARFGYTRKYARKIMADMRDGIPFIETHSKWYYSNRSLYCEFPD